MSSFRTLPQRHSSRSPSAHPTAGPACWCAALLLLGLLAGCAHAPLNAPLTHYEPDGGYRPRPQVQSRPLSVVLFLSGGGTRAAALSYGVMQELSRTPLPDGGRMLDRVEAISAVSGGCFPAAYYCLYGDRLFQDFETSFLKRKVQSTVMLSYFTPSDSWRLASAYFGRSDLSAEYIDRTLFHGATFGDLLRAPGKRPFLLINATDMDSFAQFPFTQDTFDLIGSDLSSYPIARAIAASSAVPVVLTPITLRNYAGRLPAPESPQLLAPGTNPSPYSRRQQAIADLARSYLDAVKRPYIHLLDGGLADNLGLSNLLAAVTQAGGWEALLRERNHGEVTQLAIVVVNAATKTEAEWTQEGRTPGLRSVVSALSKNTISRTNGAMLELIRESLDDWQRSGVPGTARPQVHLINVDFTQLADPVERNYFNRVPTRFQLHPEMVDRLVDIGGRLLRESPDFRALRAALEQAPANTPAAAR